MTWKYFNIAVEGYWAWRANLHAHVLLYDPQEDKTAGRWCVSNEAEVILKGQTEITEDKRLIFQHNAVDNVLN